MKKGLRFSQCWFRGTESSFWYNLKFSFIAIKAEANKLFDLS